MIVRPETFEERMVWYAITCTYLFFLAGALYVLAPALAWTVVAVWVWRQTGPDGEAAGSTLPLTVLLWLAGMLAMQFALLVAHVDFSLGIGQTMKSSIGWAKGWALLALFPLIGCMAIRPEILYRAACILSAQTLFIALPLAVLGYLAGVPEVLYVSPLQAVGGPGPEFFDVSIYSINPDNGMPRWRLFTPWGPALGFVGAVYFFLALHEKSPGWRIVGMASALAMVVASGSRLGLVAIPAVLGASWVITHIRQPSLHWLAAAVFLIAGLFGLQLFDFAEFLQERFHAARPESSRVRAILGRIAIDRWLDEAVIWGHGVVEKGPHLVEFMPIGSHHSWYGLLFVKGIVGFAALAVPMAWSAVDLLRRHNARPAAKPAFQLLLLLFLYSFGENLEILAYLFWPALVMIGIALRGALKTSRPAAHNKKLEETFA